jgi:TPR repeat protein
LANHDHSIRMRIACCHVAMTAMICLSCSGTYSFAADLNIQELQRAAERGYIPKQIQLAGDYFVGRGVPQDAKRAAYWYKKAAESGDPWAENQLGFLCQTGQGVQADPDCALHWYQLAAASGLPIAKVNLGVMYFWGISVPKDEVLAAQLFREAAAKGSGVAATYLGDINSLGLGVKQDKAIGEAWYEEGVKMRDPFAEFDMALLLSTSQDHQRDLPRAVKLLRQSAAAGFVPAMHSLGLLLTNHPELADSHEEAWSLLEAAANAGCWKSSVVLGVIARDGGGNSGGLESAFYHFQIAILQSGEEARRLLSNDLHALEKQLTEKQRSVLASEANAWYSKHNAVFEFVFQDRDSDRASLIPALALTAVSKGIHAGTLVPSPSL